MADDALYAELEDLQDKYNSLVKVVQELIDREQDLGSLALPDDLDENAREARELEQDERIAVLEIGEPPDLTPELISSDDTWFLAKIVSLGPDSEADYTDERYWVKEQQISNSSGADTTALTFSDVTNPRHVTATNLPEWDVLYGVEQHWVQPNRIVMVRAVFDAAGLTRYFFVSPPDFVECP